MYPTTRLLAPGLTKRSLDEASRFLRIALRGEGVSGRFPPRTLVDFTDPDTIPQCKAMSDDELGGFSSAYLDHVSQTALEPAHARFHGAISTELPRSNPGVQRTGFAGWRNKDRKPTIFGRSLWDLDPYLVLALRVKSDGRRYFVNLQTESVVHTDIHQHRLHTKKIGEWETVFIGLASFVRTNQGEVVEPQSEMMVQKVRTVGFSLTDRVPGPFDIAISKVWAAINLDQDETLSNERGLKSFQPHSEV